MTRRRQVRALTLNISKMLDSTPPKNDFYLATRALVDLGKYHQLGPGGGVNLIHKALKGALNENK